jgi:putative DNA methylase
MKRLGEWSFRGYIPHYNADSTFQAITFRLCDSLPKCVRLKISALAAEGLDQQIKIQRSLDHGYGRAFLRESRYAKIIQDALIHFHGARYHLHAWVIMPNHVHALVETLPGRELGQVVKTWKGFTAWKIAKEESAFFAEHGRIWEPDYFDRYIRNASHYESAVAYIHENPVKAGLVANLASGLGAARWLGEFDEVRRDWR